VFLFFKHIMNIRVHKVSVKRFFVQPQMVRLFIRPKKLSDSHLLQVRNAQRKLLTSPSSTVIPAEAGMIESIYFSIVYRNNFAVARCVNAIDQDRGAQAVR
jgi:hypothetical protein